MLFFMYFLHLRNNKGMSEVDGKEFVVSGVKLA